MGPSFRPDELEAITRIEGKTRRFPFIDADAKTATLEAPEPIELVNDKGKHTFFCSNNRPQVLDLIWLHEDASLPLTIDIAFSITGTLSDHRELSL